MIKKSIKIGLKTTIVIILIISLIFGGVYMMKQAEIKNVFDEMFYVPERVDLISPTTKTKYGGKYTDGPTRDDYLDWPYLLLLFIFFVSFGFYTFILNFFFILVHFISIHPDRETLRKIYKVLEDCTPTQRRRFELRYFKQMTYREIAELENVNISNVQSSLQLLRKKLKKFFSK